MDCERQTEDFRGEGVGEGDSLVMGSREARIAWCTGCNTQLMKHQNIHRKLGKNSMVINTI